MTTQQTSFLSEIEAGEQIPLGKLAYLRERTRNRLHSYILDKFIEQGISQATLGRRINRRAEVINRWLGAPGNWTLDTISDLLIGIAAEELEPASRSLLGRAARNHTHPDWFVVFEIKSDNPMVNLTRPNIPSGSSNTSTTVAISSDA